MTKEMSCKSFRIDCKSIKAPGEFKGGKRRVEGKSP